MTDAITLVHVEAHDIAVIHVTVPRSEIMHAMGPGIRELVEAAKTQGIGITGPWFTHHSRRPTDTFDLDIGIPVASPVRATGRVRPARWPAMRSARTEYAGDYSGLGDAWGAFLASVRASGYDGTADLWEVYLVGCEASASPANWRTQLNQPLLD